MAGEVQATLRDASGNTLVTVLVRSWEATENHSVRNLEGVQPPASNRQGVFGSGIHQAGAWERDVALCNVSGYATLGHAMSALETAIGRTRAIRFDGWELPVAAGVGIVERQLLLVGFRARVQLIPASPHWRYLSGTKAGTGSQSGLVITGSGFVATDVGRLLVFASGAEALITGYTSATEVSTDTEQTVSSQAFTVYDAATGLL